MIAAGSEAANGFDRAGHNGVDGDVVLREFLRQRPSQPDHAGFGGDGMNPALCADMRRYAAQIDNRAAPRSDNMRCRSVGAVESAIDRGAHDLPPFGRGQFQELGLPANGGVVHQHVQPPESRDSRVDQGLRLLGVGDVGQIHIRLPACFVNQTDSFAAVGLGLAGGDHDAETIARQMLGDGAADVQGAASDQGHLGFFGHGSLLRWGPIGLRMPDGVQ